MKNSILVITGIAIALGILAGAFIGSYGTVEIPLNHNSPGKIRVNIKGSLVDFVALTDENQEFFPGDRVVVVRMKGNRVWVVGV
jgi:membrane protein implicated in regulation of membrane protease activity